MDFDWSAADRAYRERIRAFLERELPADWARLSREGPGSKAVTDFSREFCPKLAAEGLLVPHWPAEWGGADRPTWEHFILGEEMWAANEPRGAVFWVALQPLAASGLPAVAPDEQAVEMDTVV